MPVAEGRAAMLSALEKAETILAQLSGDGAARHFGRFGVGVWGTLAILLGGGAAFGLWKLGVLNVTSGGIIAGCVALGIVVVNVMASMARKRVATVGGGLAVALTTAEKLADALPSRLEAEAGADIAELEADLDEDVQEVRETSETLVHEIVEVSRERRLAVVGAFREREEAALHELHAGELPAIDEAEAKELSAIEAQSMTEIDRYGDDFEAKTAELQADYQRKFADLKTEWGTFLEEVREKIAAWDAQCGHVGGNWDDVSWKDWQPAETPCHGIGFGSLVGGIEEVFGDVPTHEDLALVVPEGYRLPAALSFPDRCNLLIEGREKARPQALATLQHLVMQLLTRVPPGEIRLTFVDPVGLGQTFAGFMHLADHDETLVGGRIWTDERQIDDCIKDLTSHMENVIQKYLRNEYETIAEYNAAAGEIAEPYRFLVIADFPVNFSEASVRRLMSIADSGARCGVYVLAFWDVRQPKPPGFSSADFRKSGIHLNYRGDGLAWKGEGAEPLLLTTQEPPPAPLQSDLLRKVGEASSRRARVMVPFASVAPPNGELWTRDCDHELTVPIGQMGTRIQSLALGRGTAQHVLVAGNTGSGKSTLLHVLITNAASWYSPEELRFFLIDFKKGVEFKAYATQELPHAEAIAIESDRGFGLSVLQRVDEILRERGETLRKAGVQGLPAYRALEGVESMPRILLVIDEFQEFFVEDDQVSQDAARLLDRIVRQGRAFGIHVLLGSQTLGGAYSLARATMGQMAVRIALQCSEQDSYLILGEDNTAARLLSRPGEAIYNDASGAVAGNSPFQVVWLPEEERDKQLTAITTLQNEQKCASGGPAFVFEGNQAADVRRNAAFCERLAGKADKSTMFWLGVPNAIKGPTSVTLQRFGGNNVLMLGQREEAGRSLCGLAALALMGGGAEVHLLDGTHGFGEEDGGFSELPTVKAVGPASAGVVVDQLHTELVARQGGQSTNSTTQVLVIYGLQRFRKLRTEDEYAYDSGNGPDRQLLDLLRDGPELGIHVIAWCDSLANLNRTLPRRLQGEFDHRILFQMSANDSMSMVDTAAASRLGEVQAIYHNEQAGLTLQTFNPYAMPSGDWLAEAMKAKTFTGVSKS
jgi:hypothetical protein